MKFKYQTGGNIIPKKKDSIYVLGYEPQVLPSIVDQARDELSILVDFKSKDIASELVKGDDEWLRNMIGGIIVKDESLNEDQKDMFLDSLVAYYSKNKKKVDDELNSIVDGQIKNTKEFIEKGKTGVDTTFTKEFNRAGKDVLKKQYNKVNYIPVRDGELKDKMSVIPKGSNIMFMDHRGDRMFGEDMFDFADIIGEREPQICIGGTCYGEQKFGKMLRKASPNTQFILDKDQWTGFDTSRTGLEAIIKNNPKDTVNIPAFIRTMEDLPVSEQQKGGEVQLKQSQIEDWKQSLRKWVVDNYGGDIGQAILGLRNKEVQDSPFNQAALQVLESGLQERSIDSPTDVLPPNPLQIGNSYLAEGLNAFTGRNQGFDPLRPLTGDQLTLSQAANVDNPVGAFALDMIDPSILTGLSVGAIGKALGPIISRNATKKDALRILRNNFRNHFTEKELKGLKKKSVADLKTVAEDIYQKQIRSLRGVAAESEEEARKFLTRIPDDPTGGTYFGRGLYVTNSPEMANFYSVNNAYGQLHPYVGKLRLVDDELESIKDPVSRLKRLKNKRKPVEIHSDINDKFLGGRFFSEADVGYRNPERVFLSDFNKTPSFGNVIEDVVPGVNANIWNRSVVQDDALFKTITTEPYREPVNKLINNIKLGIEDQQRNIGIIGGLLSTLGGVKATGVIEKIGELNDLGEDEVKYLDNIPREKLIEIKKFSDLNKISFDPNESHKDRRKKRSKYLKNRDKLFKKSFDLKQFPLVKRNRLKSEILKRAYYLEDEKRLGGTIMKPNDIKNRLKSMGLSMDDVFKQQMGGLLGGLFSGIGGGKGLELLTGIGDALQGFSAEPALKSVFSKSDSLFQNFQNQNTGMDTANLKPIFDLFSLFNAGSFGGRLFKKGGRVSSIQKQFGKYVEGVQQSIIEHEYEANKDQVIDAFNQQYADSGIGVNEVVPKLQGGGIPVSPNGLFDFPGQSVIVPTQDGIITMDGVNQNVLAIDQAGNQSILPANSGLHQLMAGLILEIPIEKKKKKRRKKKEMGLKIPNTPRTKSEDDISTRMATATVRNFNHRNKRTMSKNRMGNKGLPFVR